MKAGIIELRFDSRYHELIRAVTQSQVDAIGFYYPSGDIGRESPAVIIYDNYTGNLLGSNSLTLAQISRDANLTQLVSYPFKGEIGVFRMAIGRLLSSQLDLAWPELGPAKQDQARLRLSQLILQTQGLSGDQRPYYTGLALVNRVLYALAGQDYARHKSESGEYLLSSPWLGEAQIISREAGGAQPHYLRSELETYFKILSSTLEELYLSQPLIRERVLEKLGSLSNFQVTPAGASPVELDTPSSSTGELPGVAPKLLTLRAQLENLVAEIRSGVPPVIQLNQWLLNLNSALETVGLEPIASSGLAASSYGSVIATGPVGERVKILLKAGETLILPIQGAELTTLETETLQDVLWYLDSLVEVHDLYLPLQIAVGRELALRVKS